MTCPLPVTDYTLISSNFAKVTAALRYLLTRGGPLAGNSTDAVAYLRSGAPGHDELDLKYYLIPLLTGNDGLVKEHGVTNLVILTRPESRGQLRLRSANPMDKPIIDANYLAAERDREALRRGVRIARDIFAQSAYDRYRGREYLPGAQCTSDADLDAFFRNTCSVNYEAVGTCKMGKDELAVVNDKLQVHGVDGLRVVDGSVMPRITTGDPGAPIIMIAEKAADLILELARA
jgi:choline dehydrogenase